MNLIKELKSCMSEDKESYLVTFLNPYSYMLARKDVELFSQFRIEIDGIALVKILRFLGFKAVRRQSFDMTSLAPIILNEAIENRRSVYFIGTEPGVIDRAVENISLNFPNLNIVGFRDGYVEENIMKSLLGNIMELNPDIVICGMGTPKQEQFLLSLKNSGWNGDGFTCGGFLHQTAEGIQYYPEWVDRFNIRWMYRIYSEPKLFKRYFWMYPKSLAFIAYDFFRYKINW